VSARSGIARIVREDLPHAAAGAAIALLCHVLGALDPVSIGLAILVGFGRELWQMARERDKSFGSSRVRDALGWPIGAILAIVAIRAYAV